MGKYHGVDCPICHEPLENGKPIAVCPECGAPYHKECIEQTGSCIFEDLHREGKTWEAPKPEEKYAPDEARRCSRCGTLNPVGSIFCVVCGNQLTSSDAASQEPSADPFSPFSQPGQGPGGSFSQQNPYGQKIPFQMPYDPYNTPFGGVNPDDSINGIPVRDWAIFVGTNTPYFIPKFKEMSDGNRRSTFNFAAMFFQGYYFLFRKMYVWGILTLILQLVLELPYALLAVNSYMQQVYGGGFSALSSDGMVMLSNIGMILGFVLRACCGIFANRLYMEHAKKKIGKLKQSISDDAVYREQLTKSGSIARNLVIGLVFVYFALMFLSMFIGF